ncbi:4-hydroxy-tetrahydrodipicolinate reductase [Brucepastera parasyntrophica]|uniref:4-hydroxy-tetrahydrodipicolinate reductase n=1 Tax=Brucepastera parasyntrophica TaxID=2880008 RepID=UPI00210E9316|nr:4-hydroxy-tetrahydrodipicolinate reductase [Brucepastera parasyntrophica]ULQ59695.1 4-hydroxy-tetrahydrodipicolinate reductase [Brucepastera parasyntrophica]
MKVALVGYGKMGHMIARAAELRGHTIVCTVDLFAEDAQCVTSDKKEMVAAIAASGAEGIIEFSHPASVMDNLVALIPTKLPLVVGTTGWRDHLEDVEKLVHDNKSALLYSANFSVGVNLFYRIVSYASRLMADFDEYDAAVFEAHHNQKADSPSGTGIDIAKHIIENLPRKKTIITELGSRKILPEELQVSSLRVGSVTGTHSVIFDSPADTIELTHRARNREGFALGAVRALEWLAAPEAGQGPKTGLFSMDDIFDSL